MIVLDAGVLIGLATPVDPFHAAAAAAVRRLRDQGTPMVLAMTAYAEVLVRPYRDSNHAVERVERFVRRLPLGLQPVDREIARSAAQLRARERALRLPDALVLATAQVLGAGVVTTDHRWPDVGVSVEVLRP